MFGKSSNDTQENPKDALKFTNFHEKYTKPTETTELNSKIAGLSADKENLTNQLNASQKQVQALEQSQQVLKNGNDELKTEKERLTKEKENLTKEKTELTEKNKNLTTDKERLERENKNLATEKERLTKEKDNLNDQLNASQKQVQALEIKKAELLTENQNLAKQKTELTETNQELTIDKENLTTALSNAKTQAEQTSQKLNELERRHAPYQKLEKLYEVFSEVKDRLNFNFVATTHSAMDLIASVLSDSKYYLESLYNKASQELSDKRSDKGEKLAELFDLLFEYIKDSKFERLKEPSAYDYSCKTLYPEQNSSQKMQRVVLRGYTYDKKIACYTIVDMGS
ncbi:hypothetical protein JT196_03775 [Helicobacter pylori]|nr:hypothetical protein [Helicobacter pylori]